jgi:UDP-GlcNAc3NAcA epimerase
MALRRIMERPVEDATHLLAVLPLHPRTRAALERDRLLQIVNEAVNLMAPLGFLNLTGLELVAAVIATDSGGVQKEAFFQRIPCVTIRSETEWAEQVDRTE